MVSSGEMMMIGGPFDKLEENIIDFDVNILCI